MDMTILGRIAASIRPPNDFDMAAAVKAAAADDKNIWERMLKTAGGIDQVTGRAIPAMFGASARAARAARAGIGRPPVPPPGAGSPPPRLGVPPSAPPGGPVGGPPPSAPPGGGTGGPPPSAPPSSPIPGPSPGRGSRFPGWKTSLGLGAVGAGGTTLGYGHLDQSAQETVGRSLNPLTWLNPQSNQQVFDRAVGRYTGQQGAMNDQIGEALMSGDDATAQRLLGQQESGEFGQGNRFFGLNPWGSQSARHYADVARGIQSQDQGRIDLRNKFMADNPNMPEGQREIIGGQQAEALKRLGVKIPFGGKPATPAATPKAEGTWATGRRPAAPASPNLGRFDYRNTPSAWEPIIDPIGAN